MQKNHSIASLVNGLSEPHEAPEEIIDSTTHPINLIEYMQIGYAYCKIIVEDGKACDFIHIEVNESYRKLTGLNNVVGCKATAVLPGITESNPEFIEKHIRVAESGSSDQFEIYLKALNKWYDISVYSPKKGYFIAMFKDITDRRVAEVALRQSEERFRKLFEEHSAIMMIIDPDTGAIIDANQAAARFYGWSIEELRRMHIQKINTLPAEEVKTIIDKSRSSKQNCFSLSHRRADGSIRDVDVFSNNINVAGKDLIYSIIHDTTDRKRYESLTSFRLRLLQTAESDSARELLMATLDYENGEKSIHSLFDAFPEPMFLVDQEGTILVTNKAFTTRFNTDQEHILGSNMYTLLPHELAVERKNKMEEVLYTGERMIFEEELAGRIYRHTIYPIPNKEGEITKLLIFNVDVTTLNLNENEHLDQRIHYRNLFNNMLNGFAYCRMLYDGDHPVDFVHEAVNLNLKKLTRIQNLEGKKISEIIPDIHTSNPEFIERLGRVAQTGVAERFEFYFITLHRWFDIAAYSHQKGYFVMVLMPRKIMNTGHWEWNLKNGEMVWSNELCMLFVPDKNSGNPCYDDWLNAIAPGDRGHTRQTTQKAVAKGKPFNVVYHISDAEGTIRQLMTQGLPVKSDNGLVTRYMGISIDITEYKNEDNNTLISTSNLANLLKSCMEPLCSITPDGKILEENADFTALYAINTKSLKVHDFHKLFSEELREERKRKFEHVFNTGEPVHFKDKCRGSQGISNQEEEYIYQISTYPIYGENKKIDSLAVFISDINEHNEAEKARRQLDKKYQTLIAASPDSIITTDLNGIVNSVSDVGLEIFGAKNKADVIGMSFSEIVYPDDIKILDEIFDVTLREGLIQNKEILLKKKNNTIYSAEISAALIQDYNSIPSSYMMIIRDISRRKIIERELFYAKRLISLGEMASGIAHEIYQPINNIGLIVDKILLNASQNNWNEEKEIKLKSEKIFENILRVQTIIDNIHSFSSTDKNYISSVININKSITNTLLMVSEQCRHKSIILDFEPEQERFSVAGNIYKFEQVILNLIKNSIDALEEKKHLKTSEFEMKILIRSFYENNSILVSVEDNGIGISEKNLEYIMHPFYTTKESGKGTGLGLSISYGIIKEMNGDVNITSLPMRGTLVTITLPKMVNLL
jgi:PAS domain S-box-containing protein